jgi:hypothetical protein
MDRVQSRGKNIHVMGRKMAVELETQNNVHKTEFFFSLKFSFNLCQTVLSDVVSKENVPRFRYDFRAT